MNRQYLESVRSKSCYPAFRRFVQIFTLLGYLVAAVIAIPSIISGSVFPFAAGALAALMIRVAKEASLMLADIADATIDSSAKSASIVNTIAAAPQNDAAAA